MLIISQMICIILLLIDIVARLYYIGNSALKSKFLLYELITLTLVLISQFLSLYFQHEPLFIVTHYLILLRFPRFYIGLTLIFPSYKQIYSVFIKLWPFCSQLGSVLFIFFFIYAAIGESLFGGMLTFETNFETGCLDIVNPLYVYNNFNDMSSGMITLFELMMVNNWQYNVKVWTCVTGTEWVKVFFISWYFIAVILGLDLLVAPSI